MFGPRLPFSGTAADACGCGEMQENARLFNRSRSDRKGGRYAVCESTKPGCPVDHVWETTVDDITIQDVPLEDVITELFSRGMAAK